MGRLESIYAGIILRILYYKRQKLSSKIFTFNWISFKCREAFVGFAFSAVLKLCK